jgi:LmbE family N-acetylglucosaminyl deacetylase
MGFEKRLLGVFAHPDDETFGSGGTLARYASEGVDITVVCATRGEVGEIAPGSMATPQTLGAVREAETRSALSVLGVQNLVVLGYRDSGMMGSEDNKNPLAFINVPILEVVERLVEIIRKHRPHVVITMDPSGGYGHPDHIRVVEITTQAFKVAGDPSFFPRDAEKLWSPDKLYYHVFPRSRVVRWLNHIRETDPSRDISRLDPNNMGTADEEITTVLDVSNFVELKIRAAQQHRSQRSPFTTLPDEIRKEILGKDCWLRAEPHWDGGEVETDLFNGL